MIAMQGLSYEDMPTGVLFGFFRQMLLLSKKFESTNFVFCWDSQHSYRKRLYPSYKEHRQKEMTEEEKFMRSVGYPQFSQLRRDILPRLGFVNNFMQTGIEADDLIASVVDTEWGRKEAGAPIDDIVIISTDSDLWQLLANDWITQYSHISKELYTEEKFKKEYGIHPSRWPNVRALTGCKTDNIKGIKGIGEKTAAKFVNITLKKGKAHESILAFQKAGHMLDNLQLIRLPFFKTERVILQPFGGNHGPERLEVFESMCIQYGFHSFLKKDEWNKWKEFFNVK
jgi:5'-3' exonuclease